MEDTEIFGGWDPEFARAIAATPEPYRPTPLIIARALTQDAEKVHDHRIDMLFSSEEYLAEKFTPKAEQHFLSALAHLSNAEHALKLAALEMNA